MCDYSYPSPRKKLPNLCLLKPSFWLIQKSLVFLNMNVVNNKIISVKHMSLFTLFILWTIMQTIYPKNCLAVI